MTLITTLLCDSHVLQVSARRDTSMENGRLVDKDNMRNNAIPYCSRIAIEYTGVATIGSATTGYTYTDEWLAKQLGECATNKSLPR